MIPSDEQILSFRPALVRQATALCRNREEGEDVVQDVIERMLRYRPEVDSVEGLGRVMRQTCVWRWTDRGRSKQSAIRIAKRLAAFTMETAALPSQYHATLLGEVAARIPRLPPIHRQALMARARGETCTEMAATWGVEVGTTKSRLARARDALGAMIGEEISHGPA
jgi:DNA-directed RNA polymerase specialized sigma24 family protein